MAQTGSLRDAWLIAGAQRVEHYETAAYGTLVAWARAMGVEPVKKSKPPAKPAPKASKRR